jgi:arsenate reductase
MSENRNLRPTIYHNPRCSKSRQTLALLEERGVAPRIVEYLKTPPTAAELKTILKKLGLKPRDILRQGEPRYAELGLKDRDVDDDALIALMVANPILIERPIVVRGNKAAIGRPPETVLEIL